MKKKILAIFLAFLAAILYSISTPFSKALLAESSSTMMAAFLYLGAGFGMSIIYLFTSKKEKENKLDKKDLPYTIGMVLLDIAAPILLMIGLSYSFASSASLLNNFEIVATTIIAYLFFKEKVSKKTAAGIILVTLASIILSLSGDMTFTFSKGSLLIILATICWGLENNCTRSISNKNTYEIVMIKGLFSGLGSLLIGLFIGDVIPGIYTIVKILILGFIAYGLSIFFYVKAQREIGASKTSAYYAVNPFIGSLLSFIFLKEEISLNYFLALGIMIIGSLLMVLDTLKDDN